MRLALTGWALIATITVAGCREPTAPERTLHLIVEPALLRIEPSSGFVQVTYTIRNSTQSELFTDSSPDVQVQSTSGGWTTIEDPNAIYIQSTLGVVIAADFDQQRGKYQRLLPGRYRLLATYWRWDPVRGASTGDAQEAISNEFVVTR